MEPDPDPDQPSESASAPAYQQLLMARQTMLDMGALARSGECKPITTLMNYLIVDPWRERIPEPEERNAFVDDAVGKLQEIYFDGAFDITLPSTFGKSAKAVRTGDAFVIAYFYYHKVVMQREYFTYPLADADVFALTGIHRISAGMPRSAAEQRKADAEPPPPAQFDTVKLDFETDFTAINPWRVLIRSLETELERSTSARAKATIGARLQAAKESLSTAIERLERPKKLSRKSYTYATPLRAFLLTP